MSEIISFSINALRSSVIVVLEVLVQVSGAVQVDATPFAEVLYYVRTGYGNVSPSIPLVAMLVVTAILTSLMVGEVFGAVVRVSSVLSRTAAKLVMYMAMLCACLWVYSVATRNLGGGGESTGFDDHDEL
ncbi:hypothetical protein H9P43_004002 [Blastocladiella emersonii ATCC 22665]|nr:hypothetical protein H9P43_004002 [Blastocladiella emersonii ATCC 22665]